MWFPSLFSRGRTRAPRPRPARRKPSSVRPTLELLEDRTVPSGVDVVSGDPHDWPMFGHDAAGTRYNSAEHRLRPDNVGELQELWRFDTAGAISGTPVVVNNKVYAGDISGKVYALTSDGELLWQTTLNVPSLINPKINASPVVTNRTVVIGDMAGQIHGLDVDTGQVRWTTRPPNPGPIFGNQHPFQMIMGAGTMVGNHVAFGVASLENFYGPLGDPNYPGFTFRGNVVLIDPADGRIVWQTFTVPEATLQPDGSYGPNGTTVWGSPAYDRASNTLFVGTGQHYGPPTTNRSDALIALDGATGAIKWVSQMTPDDTYNITFGPPSDNDLDIGDSPQLYRLNGRLVVAAGQKSGVFHVVDAETGEHITPPQQYLAPGGLGGFHIDSGFANGVNYAPGNSWGFIFNHPTPSDAGAVFAISGDGSTQLWKFDTDAPILGGVAIANGVVYVQDVGGRFYALDAATGEQLATLVTGTPVQGSGPAISRGQIYVGTGDVLTPFLVPFPLIPPGSIVALGLPAAPSRPMSGNGSGTLNPFTGAFTATGNATHLGAFTHYGTILLTPTTDPNIFLISGRTTYEADNGDKLYAILSGTLNLATGVATGFDIWDGGTGRFANARGTVQLTAQLLEGGAFTFELVGNLSY
ncbi:MAG: PQQ-binding-like beta-propeller repeat protein [Gemmataceae bacterium]|nr:PQQ-binding-like beta-propeller repeat protein [Gemmataceae bacterium]